MKDFEARTLHEIGAEGHMPVEGPLYYKSVVVALSGLMKTVGFVHEGDEHLQSLCGPVILAASHYSNLDTPALAVAVHEATGDQVHFVGKKEMDKPVLRHAVIRGGGIFVDREKSVMPRVTREEILARLHANAIVGIFPYGTRDNDGPTRKPITKDMIHGVHMLAAESGAPVVPVGVAGTRKGDRWPVAVTFHEPIFPEMGQQKWTRVARGLQSVIADAMEQAQLDAEALRTHATTRR